MTYHTLIIIRLGLLSRAHIIRLVSLSRMMAREFKTQEISMGQTQGVSILSHLDHSSSNDR